MAMMVDGGIHIGFGSRLEGKATLSAWTFPVSVFNGSYKRAGDDKIPDDLLKSMDDLHPSCKRWHVSPEIIACGSDPPLPLEGTRI